MPAGQLQDQSHLRKKFPEHCYPNVSKPKEILSILTIYETDYYIGISSLQNTLKCATKVACTVKPLRNGKEV